MRLITGRLSATLMCSGPVSGESTNTDASRIETRFLRPLPSSVRGEKLEVLILNVLDGVRRNLSVGKEPVQVARTSAIEAELYWSVRRAGHDPRLEIDLEIDHEVKPPLRQLRGDISERHQAPGAIEDDYVLDRPVAPHECRR